MMATGVLDPPSFRTLSVASRPGGFPLLGSADVYSAASSPLTPRRCPSSAERHHRPRRRQSAPPFPHSRASPKSAANTWLREHAQPGEVLLNDGAGDAGIWAPYKAGVSIVLPRTRAVSPDSDEILLRTHVAEIDSDKDVQAAACALQVHYVYRGAASSAEARQFPSLEALHGDFALNEVFSSGNAAVFRTHLDCTA